MKKLLMAILTAGLAVGAFADYTEGELVPSGPLDFEDGTIGQPYAFDAEEEAPYWVNIDGKNTVAGTEEAKYLHLDTDGETSFRAFDDPSDWAAGTTNAVAMGEALWVDSLVKFTASTEAPTLDDGAKFALWMKEDDSGETSTYELHVLCGTVSGGGAVTVGDIALDATVSPTNWYRLTVRPQWDGDEETGANMGFFTIKLGNTDVAAVFGQTIVADPSTWTADSQALIETGKLFPSRVNNEDDSDKLVAVGFNGTGDIDNFTITDTDPSYVPVASVSLDITSTNVVVGEEFTLTATVLPVDATTKTITWSSDTLAVATVVDGVVKAVATGTATITAKCEMKSATCTATVEAGGSITVVVPTDPSGNWTAAAEPTSAAEGTEVTMTWTAAEGKLFANGEPTISITGDLKADGTLDATYPTAEELTTSVAQAKIGDKKYLTLNAALNAAEKDDTVTLLTNIETSDAAAFTINKDITLDFDAYMVTKTVANHYTFDIANGATVVFTGKLGGVSQTASDKNPTSPASMIRNKGNLTIEGGVYTSDFCIIKNDEDPGAGTLTVNGGTFNVVETEGGYTGFQSALMNWSTATINGGTWNGAINTRSSDANAVSKAATTEITAKLEGEVTYVLSVGYEGDTTCENLPKIKGIALENVELKKLSTITDTLKLVQSGDYVTVAKVTYATLTITQVENCSIVVSNETAEVISGAKFDVDDATELTIYRTPAEGYELDNCAAKSKVIMTEDKNVTAAVKVITPKAKVVKDGTTIKFVYDTVNYGTHGTDWYYVTESDDWQWSWYDSTTKVIFDSTFAEVRPTTFVTPGWGCGWFQDFEKLTTIEGIENLNTSEATNMANMFDGCKSLTTLDVSGFVTTNVTSMSCMFRGCTGLAALDVTGFDTAKVTDMGGMFSGCTGLTTIDVSGFVTTNVTNMGGMFMGCTGLTTLDVVAFDTAKVEGMGNMFNGCTNLTTIVVSNNFVTTAVTTSTGMFTDCAKLVGGKGTKYDAGVVDATYARIDGGTAAPGYFTSNVPASDPVEPGNDGTAITPNQDGSVTIQENETNPGQASIKVNDADTVIKVTSTINKIILSTGSETPAAGKIVVLSGNGTDITAYCKMTQTDNVIDVSLDEETVKPEAKEPTSGTIADGKVSTAAVKGLEYSLVRTAELGVKGTSVVTARAEGDTVSLEDPMTGGKPTQAFYTIEVTK